MTKTDAFDKAWQEKCQRAQELGIPMKRTLDSIGSFGGVETARRVFARRRNSDGFAALAKAGRLDLSLEALVLEPAYGGLFTDEEANFALESLLEAGYYKLG